MVIHNHYEYPLMAIHNLFLLLTLGYADLIESLWHGAIQLHVLYNISSLSLVRCDHSNLCWFDTILHQLSNNLLNIGSLSSMERKEEREELEK